LATDPALLIVEVQMTGEKASDDFIKIYNPTDSDIYLGNYQDSYIRLVKRTKTSTKDYTIKSWYRKPDAKIPAKEFYLWANKDYATLSNVDAVTFQTIAANNGIALRLGPENTGLILDSVGWGDFNNALFEETSFLENPGANQQLKRKTLNRVYQDTNNNSQDFYLYPPPGEEPQLEPVPGPVSEPAADAEQSLQNPARQLAPSTTELKPTPEAKEPESVRIDINSASTKDLQKITGVGPVLAQRIIDTKPFYSLDELTKVSGIGPKTLEDIKKQGLAWLDPALKPPQSEKTEPLDKGLLAAAVTEPFRQGHLGGQVPKSLFIFLIALVLAVFSGTIILTLKKKLKTLS